MIPANNYSKKTLPSRAALNALGKSQRSIQDYAKAVPQVATVASPVVQLMRKKPPIG